MTDLELCRFLDLGYHVIQPDSIPDATHDRLYEAATHSYQQRGEISDPIAALDTIADNLHVRMPELNQLLHCEALDSALAQVLGKSYFRYGHSFVHLSSEYDQTYHKDSPLPWGTRGGIRSHLPNWAMVFYYPQTVTLDMGATEILPGTQYWNVDREGSGRTEGEDRLDSKVQAGAFNKMSEDERDQHLQKQVPELDRHLEPLRLVLPKGSLVLVHFDLFHRGTRRISDDVRYMYKFWYVRTTEPSSERRLRTIHFRASDPRRQNIVVKNAAMLGLNVVALDTPELQADEEQEADRLASAHERIETNPASIVKAFKSGSESEKRSAMYALVGQDEHAKSAAYGLIDSASKYDRARAAFLLGELNTPSEKDIETLLMLSAHDEDTDVKMAATNAVGHALRRNISHGHAEVPAKLMATWDDALNRSSERNMRSGLIQSAERQCIYLALLNIVSAFAAGRSRPEVLEDIAQLVGQRLDVEMDRYAKSTALEVVARLAEIGNQTALTKSLTMLRNERWSTVSAVA